MGICRQKLRQGDHGRVGELRQERLHALCRDLLRDLGQQLHQSRVARVLLGELAGALSHGIGNRQLPRRVDGHLADVDIVDGALVRHGELADIRDLVAPELHAHRVVQGGGKDIEDAAADGVLAALGHHVHVRVGAEVELSGQRVELELGVLCQADGFAAGDVLDHRLRVAAGGGDDDLEVVIVTRDAVEHLRAPTHDVRAGAKPLVRKRLPRRQVGHLVAQHGRQLRGEVFRFAPGGGDH